MLQISNLMECLYLNQRFVNTMSGWLSWSLLLNYWLKPFNEFRPYSTDIFCVDYVIEGYDNVCQVFCFCYCCHISRCIMNSGIVECIIVKELPCLPITLVNLRERFTLFMCVFIISGLIDLCIIYIMWFDCCWV